MTPEASARRHFVITGAGTGIGRAIATRLASTGAVLTLLGRRVALLEDTARDLPGARIHLERCDVRQRADVDHAFDKAAEAFGPVHALVANAGIGGENHPGPQDRFGDIIATNLGGTYNCLRATERHFPTDASPKHVVVISSILARIGVPGYTAYCASKAGLLGLVRSAAMELAPRHVQVNAICPGWVNTEMAWQGIDAFATAAGKTREAAFEEAMKPVPLGRMSEPAEIAGLVAYLLSTEACGITGQTLDMNNGAWM
jgi:NAD(P)-dependent dehydrogenase (short-subunit alcohol dehydrogenase family)